MKKKKDKTFEEIWYLEQKIFDRRCRSTKKDLKDIYDCRELLIINDFGYAIGSPLEEVPKRQVPDKNHGKNNTTYMWSIGIMPEFCGRGLGKDLINKIIIYSIKPRISLHTTSPIMKKLCIELGFKQITKTYFVFIKRK